MKKIIPVLLLTGLLVLALALNFTVFAAPAPEDPKTYANLITTVEGETNAAAFYKAAGLKALDEGYPTIAKLFFATADAEAKHADDAWAILNTLKTMDAGERPVVKPIMVGTTLENLQAAIVGETREYTDIYPEFLETAEDEEIEEAAVFFFDTMRVEEIHEGNFTDVRELLLAENFDGINSKYAVIYRCPDCGEVVTALPTRCLICRCPGRDFVLYNQTYANLYAAVWRETNAANFYKTAATIALEEGYPIVAQLFQATADAESKHAADEWEILKKMGATAQKTFGGGPLWTTMENLKAAFEGEFYENKVMYPEFLETANAEEMADAEKIFKWAMEAEWVHYINFADVWTKLSAGNIAEINSIYTIVFRCLTCGEVVTFLPGNCPICARPGSTFEKYETHIINATAGTGGFIEPNGDVAVLHSENQAFEITAVSGYEIDQILIDDKPYDDESVMDFGEYDDGTYTFIEIESNHTIHVTFKRIFYTVIATAQVGGSIDPVGEVRVDVGEESPKFVFEADLGYVIDKLIINGEDDNYFSGCASGWIIFETEDFEEDGDITLEVLFKPSLDFIITTTTGANGHMLYDEIDLDPNDTITVEQGRIAAFMIVPDEGCTIDQILIDGKPYTSPENEDTGGVLVEGGDTWYVFYGLQNDHSINVTFWVIPTYTVTFNIGAGGSAVISGSVIVSHEGKVENYFWADKDYVIDLLTVDGEEISDFQGKKTGSWDRDNITADVTINITFKYVGEPDDPVTITATAGPGGTILPTGAQIIEKGDSLKFSIKANKYYEIDFVAIDGVTCLDAEENPELHGETEAYFQVEDVTEDCEFSVTFRYMGPAKHKVAFDSNGGSAVESQYVDNDGYADRPPDPSRDGHRFNGWYAALTGGTPYDFEHTPVTDSITLFARWTSTSSGGGGGTTSFTVTFDSNGGSAVASRTVAANTKVAKPADPTKEGYIFDGWFAASDLNAEYNFDALVTKSFTLYAKWIDDEDGGEGDDFPFTDVAESAWYYEYIKSIYELGLMNGTSDTLFSPAMPVTRGMLVTVLHRMEDTPKVEETASFSDVSAGTWYTDAVAWAETEGIVEGYPDGTFKPNQNVSRQELATVLLRYAKFIGKDQFSAGPDDPVKDNEDDELEADAEDIEAVAAVISDDLDFADAAKIADWAKEGVAFCAQNGIVEGRTGNIFDPTATATRAEFATMLHRFIEKFRNQ